jgi:serine/threonine protein kinase/tetratricopeptide (TPR) repeat protein
VAEQHPSVIGKYEVVSRLGQGGMGSLYLAKDSRIGRLVAIKVVRQDFDSPEARQRFAREAQSAGTLRHPNIVTIFDVDDFQGLPFIAMEYVDGETLSEIVRRKAPFPIAKRLEWIEELCAGLAYAHRQGVVHRDIKPANLMLDNEGSLKILDFGLARREASKFTQSQTVIGTPNYMSPEQIRAGDVGPPSDIFAVGCVLYEVLTCVEAFPGKVHQAMHKILYEEPKPLGEFLPSVDPGLVTILARSLEKEPEKRFPDLTVMRKDLAAVRQRLERNADDSATVSMPSPSPAMLRSPAGAVDGGAPTIAPGTRPGSMPGSAPHSPPASRPGSIGQGGSQRVSQGGTHRQTLEKKRAAQIEQHIAEARKQCDEAAFDKAREAIEQVLMFDPDHHVALQLVDEISAEEERAKIAKFIADVRAELQHGRLESAEEILMQAIEAAPDSPEVQQLRETMETTRREIDRARQATDMLRRAKQRFSEGSYEGAIRAVGEILAIDPNNAAARDLQAKAHEAIEAKAKRAERDAAAQVAVTEARALFEKGDEASAIAMLEAFTPPHDLVNAFLGSLRGEQVVIPPPEPIVEPLPPSGVSPVSSVSAPVPSGVAPVSSGAFSPSSVAGSHSSVAAPVSSGAFPGSADATSSTSVASGSSRNTQGSRTPMYAGLAVAAVAVIGIGLYMANGDSTRGPETAPTAAATPAPAPAPVIPPPAVVTTPTSLTDSSPKDQSDQDAIEAYKLLTAGKPADASTLVARIARRDPKNENLADLRAQIQKFIDTEKQRAAAAAAAAVAAAPANTSPSGRPPATPPATGSPAPTSAAIGTAAAPPPANNPAPTSPAAPPPITPVPKPEAAAPPPVAAPPPPSPSEVEKPAIEASIHEYANAMSRMNLQAVGDVRKYTETEAKNWQNLFKNLATYKLIVTIVGPPTVNGNRATIPVEEQVATKGKKDLVQVFQQARKTDYKLEKIGGKWMILPPG